MEQSTSKKKTAPQVKRPCHRCHGTGRAQCEICGGSGQVAKGKDGMGRSQFGRCDGCMGTKTARCRTCGGERFV